MAAIKNRRLLEPQRQRVKENRKLSSPNVFHRLASFQEKLFSWNLFLNPELCTLLRSASIVSFGFRSMHAGTVLSPRSPLFRLVGVARCCPLPPFSFFFCFSSWNAGLACSWILRSESRLCFRFRPGFLYAAILPKATRIADNELRLALSLSVFRELYNIYATKVPKKYKSTTRLKNYNFVGNFPPITFDGTLGSSRCKVSEIQTIVTESLKSEPEARFLGTKFSHRVTTLFRGNNFLSRSGQTFKLLVFRIGVAVCVGKLLCSRCSTDKVTTKACSIPPHTNISMAITRNDLHQRSCMTTGL